MWWFHLEVRRDAGLSTRTIQYRLHEYNEAPRSDIAVVRKDEPDGAKT
jgi:hypothetical protein